MSDEKKSISVLPNFDLIGNSNFIEITHKLLFDGIEDNFNKGFKLLNGYKTDEINQNFLFVLENNKALLKTQEYLFKADCNEDYLNALEYFKKVLNKDNNHFLSLLMSFLCHQRLSNFDQAEEIIRKLFFKNSELEILSFYYGVLKLRKNDYLGAIFEFDKSILQDANYSLAYSYRGMSKIYLKNLSEAFEDSNIALTKDSKNLHAFLVRSICNLIKGEDLEAISDYKNYLSNDKRLKNIFNHAIKYFNLGFNVTHITSNINNYNSHTINILKHPSHYYSDLYSKKQSLKTVMSYGWKTAVGVGTVTSYNNLFVVDIDGCNSIKFVHLFLESLGIESNYKWVIQSGSLNGYHVYFYASSMPNRFKNFAVTTYLPNSNYQDVFSKIELLWRTHVVLPPSLHKSGGFYNFVNGIPDEICSSIRINDVISSLGRIVDLNSEVSKENYQESIEE